MFNGGLVAVRSASRNNFLYASDSGATEQKPTNLQICDWDMWTNAWALQVAY